MWSRLLCQTVLTTPHLHAYICTYVYPEPAEIKKVEINTISTPAQPAPPPPLQELLCCTYYTCFLGNIINTLYAIYSQWKCSLLDVRIHVRTWSLQGTPTQAPANGRVVTGCEDAQFVHKQGILWPQCAQTGSNHGLRLTNIHSTTLNYAFKVVSRVRVSMLSPLKVYTTDWPRRIFSPQMHQKEYHVFYKQT